MCDEMTENPWNIVQSLYELQYFNCLSCSYKNKSKEDFIIHAYDFHPESINSLKNIHDGSTDNISLPWITPEKIKIEDTEDDYSTEYLNHENYIPYENDYELDAFDSHMELKHNTSDDNEEEVIKTYHRKKRPKMTEKRNFNPKSLEHKAILDNKHVIIEQHSIETPKKENVCENCEKCCTSIASLNVHQFICKIPEKFNLSDESLHQNTIATNFVIVKNDYKTEMKIEANSHAVSTIEEKSQSSKNNEENKVSPTESLQIRTFPIHVEKNHQDAHQICKQKKYKCDSCGKSFTASGSLKIHISTIHEAQRNYKCDSCGKILHCIRTSENTHQHNT